LPASRPVILHYHLFKCAGTSIEQVLKSQFGRRFATWDKSDPAAKISAIEMAAYIHEHPELVAISSHQAIPPLPIVAGARVHPVVFLRHPLDRMLSTYRFSRQRASAIPTDRLASNNSLKDYVRTLLEQGNANHASNFYVYSLTDQRDPATNKLLPVGPKRHLGQAKAFLRSLPVVGIVERFVESTAAFQSIISAELPDFRFPVVEANVTSPRQTTLETRLEYIRNELGDDLWQRLLERNAPDFELYRIAEQRLESALARESAANG